MTQAPKDIRSPADKALDTGGIVGSIEHEDYVSHSEKRGAHQRVTWDDMTTEEAIKY
jgi:hypothetical protein